MFYVGRLHVHKPWKNVDLEHYTRATREWLYAPEENKTGKFCSTCVKIRLNIITRYIAWNILKFMDCRHMEKDERNPVLKNVKTVVSSVGDVHKRNLW